MIEEKEVLSKILTIFFSTILFLLFFPILLVAAILYGIFAKIRVRVQYVSIITAIYFLTLVARGYSFIDYFQNIYDNLNQLIFNIVNQNFNLLINYYSNFIYQYSREITIFFGLILSMIFLLKRKRYLEDEYDINVYKEDNKKTKTGIIRKVTCMSSSHPKKATILGGNKDKCIKVSENMNNLLVAGSNEKSKISILTNVMKSYINKDKGIVIFDGSGETGDKTLYDFLDKYKKKKTYIIKVNKNGESTTYNPFKNKNKDEVKDIILKLINDKSGILKKYIEAIYKYNEKDSRFSINDFSKYKTKNFKMRLKNLKRKGEMNTRDYELYNEMIDENKTFIDSSIDNFMEMINYNICSEDGISIERVLEEKAIILFLLDPVVKKEVSEFLTKMAFYEIEEGIEKRKNERDIFIFKNIDRYISEDYFDILNKSNSTNDVVISTIESMLNLESKNRERVLDKHDNYIILRQNSIKSAEFWSELLGKKENVQISKEIDENEEKKIVKKVIVPEFTPDEIKSLEEKEAIILTCDTKTKEKFIIKGFR